jgi:hypothetical protein
MNLCIQRRLPFPVITARGTHPWDPRAPHLATHYHDASQPPSEYFVVSIQRSEAMVMLNGGSVQEPYK